MVSTQEPPEPGHGASAMAEPVGPSDGDDATYEEVAEEEDVPGGYMDEQPRKKKRVLPDGPLKATAKACGKEMQEEFDIDFLSAGELNKRLYKPLVSRLNFLFFNQGIFLILLFFKKLGKPNISEVERKKERDNEVLGPPLTDTGSSGSRARVSWFFIFFLGCHQTKSGSMDSQSSWRIASSTTEERWSSRTSQPSKVDELWFNWTSSCYHFGGSNSSSSSYQDGSSNSSSSSYNYGHSNRSTCSHNYGNSTHQCTDAVSRVPTKWWWFYVARCSWPMAHLQVCILEILAICFYLTKIFLKLKTKTNQGREEEDRFSKQDCCSAGPISLWRTGSPSARDDPRAVLASITKAVASSCFTLPAPWSSCFSSSGLSSLETRIDYRSEALKKKVSLWFLNYSHCRLF